MAHEPRATFDGLVAEHQRAVLGICRSILRDEHLGADAAQETFLRLWRRLGAGRAPDSLRAWLGRVAVTTSLDVARRRRVRAEADALRAADDRAAERDSTEPAHAAENAELVRMLEAAVAHLPEGQRTVFQLRHFGGLSLRDVAAVLDVALPTVKTQFARACLKLQAALAAHRPEDGDVSR
jgi:RNA polymerase sigma-70 factor (ECF subfamily)